jgi:hypothetical protein
VATDNGGATTTSAAIGITVNPAPNVPPTVSITSPANNAKFTAPASITINASAADSDGTVTQVDFYQGTTLLYTDTSAPYSYTWTGVPVGSYSFTAVATDNDGAMTTSTAVGVTVDYALLSQNQPATASTFQTGNEVAKGNDGSLSSRWGAGSGSYPQWWRVDLGASHALHRMDIAWVNAARSYRYKIEVSDDDNIYTMVVDQSARTALGDSSDSLSVTARYVRVTVTGSSAGWATAYEFKVYGE